MDAKELRSALSGAVGLRDRMFGSIPDQYGMPPRDTGRHPPGRQTCVASLKKSELTSQREMPPTFEVRTDIFGCEACSPKTARRFGTRNISSRPTGSAVLRIGHLPPGQVYKISSRGSTAMVSGEAKIGIGQGTDTELRREDSDLLATVP